MTERMTDNPKALVVRFSASEIIRYSQTVTIEGSDVDLLKKALKEDDTETVNSILEGYLDRGNVDDGGDFEVDDFTIVPPKVKS